MIEFILPPTLTRSSASQICPINRDSFSIEVRIALRIFTSFDTDTAAEYVPTNRRNEDKPTKQAVINPNGGNKVLSNNVA